MSRRGENIYKRKDKRWEARFKYYDETGKRKYVSIYGRTYKETKEKLNQFKNLITISKKESKIAEQKLLFGLYILEWLQLQRNKTKESTYVKYYNSVYNHIYPALGDKMVEEITTTFIEQFANDKLQNGRLKEKGGLSVKTINDFLTIIHSIIEYYNKCYAKTNKIQVEILYLKNEQKEIRILSTKEQAAVEQAISQDMDSYNLSILFSLYTGIRIGELCALQWKDIYLDKGFFSINKTMQRIQCVDKIGNTSSEDKLINTSSSFHTVEDRRSIKERKTKIIITDPKSKHSIRKIPIPEFLRDLLYSWECTDGERYLLTGARRYMEPRTVQYRFQKITEKVCNENINFHTLRHTFASRCIELGFDVKSLSEILGHYSVNITLNRYVHSSLEQKKKNMNNLNFLHQSVF